MTLLQGPCIVHLCILKVDGPSMVVHWDGLSSPSPESLDVSLENDLHKGDDHAEDEPDVDHLDVGCFGKIVEHSNIPFGRKNEILAWIFEFLIYTYIVIRTNITVSCQ